MTSHAMQQPRNVPEDRSLIDPWIAARLNEDVAEVESAIRDRMMAGTSPEIAEFASSLNVYVPRCIVFSNGVGYVHCVKRSALGMPVTRSTDHFYFAQPVPMDEVNRQLQYFDESARPLIKEFLLRFSGCGPEMEGKAGQFVFHDHASAVDVAYYELEKLGTWKNSRKLYSATNGDTVFINERGATTWHSLETNELVPLSDSFSEFLKHYVEFHKGGNEEFDSWSSREFLQRNSRI